MFGYQTPSNIVWWPNMLMLKWVTKRLKHVWSNTDETIDKSRWASVVRIRASDMFDTRLSKRTKHRPSDAYRRNVLRFWSNVWWPSNFIKHDQIRSNTIKQYQTRCPNGKMFGNQTMFDGVWSPNIYRLSGPLVFFNPQQFCWTTSWSRRVNNSRHLVFAATFVVLTQVVIERVVIELFARLYLILTLWWKCSWK